MTRADLSVFQSPQIVLCRLEVGAGAEARLSTLLAPPPPGPPSRTRAPTIGAPPRSPAPRPLAPAKDISSHSSLPLEIPSRFPIKPGQLHKKGAGHRERPSPSWQGFGQRRSTVVGEQKPAPGSSAPQFARNRAARRTRPALWPHHILRGGIDYKTSPAPYARHNSWGLLGRLSRRMLPPGPGSFQDPRALHGPDILHWR